MNYLFLMFNQPTDSCVSGHQRKYRTTLFEVIFLTEKNTENILCLCFSHQMFTVTSSELYCCMQLSSTKTEKLQAVKQKQ